MGDMSYLKDMPIAILGAGAIGKAAAADCALAGMRVRICDLPQFADKVLANIEDRGIQLQGAQDNLFCFERSGTARMEMVTDDIAAAVKGAGLIVIASTALGHALFFEKLIPALEEGMVIHTFTDNFGTLLLRKMMQAQGCTKKVVVGGWSSAPYGARVQEKGGVLLPRVRVGYRAVTLRGAALPMTDQEAFLESTRYLRCFDAITNGRGAVGGHTVLDINFSNINPVIHVPGTVLGVSTMENWGHIFGSFDKQEYSIYSHAFCPSVSRVQYRFYQEEMALAKEIGVGIQPYKAEQFFSRSNVLGSEFMNDDYKIPFDQNYAEAAYTGPHDIHNRYITEDVPVGCRVYHELGKKFGIKTPTIDALITLASIMTEIDYFSEGYTLDTIGIADMDKEQLLTYLTQGGV